MSDDSEVARHREQIRKTRAVLNELEASNLEGSEVFPEIQSEIDHLQQQIAQSELIVAAYEKKQAGQIGGYA
jgi:hypothetical protein